MRVRARALFKDRRGISSTAIAALFSIAVVLIFMSYINDLGNDQKLFMTIMGFFKAIGILPEDFDPWEILNSPVGPLAAYIGAYMCMLFAVIGTFVFIKWPLQAASEISAWRRKKREKERKILDKEEKLWSKRHGREDEEWYALQDELRSLGLVGYPVQKRMGYFGENLAEELHEQTEFFRKRITLSSGGSEHRMAEMWGEAWLRKQGEKNILNNKYRYGIRKRLGVGGVWWYEKFRVRPDFVGEKYIMECKTSEDWDKEFCYNQARNYIDLAAYERKKLVYMFWERPPPKDWWWDIIKELKKNKVKVIDRYGNEIKCEGE